MKTRYFLMLILLSIIVRDAIAAYNRHDGSNYSCNEINAERSYAARHNQSKAAQKLANELQKYCSGYKKRLQHTGKYTLTALDRITGTREEKK